MKRLFTLRVDTSTVRKAGRVRLGCRHTLVRSSPRLLMGERVLLQPNMLMVVALVASFVGCGPAKPTGAEYLGKWQANTKPEYAGANSYSCPLVISKNGASFLITGEGEFATGNICSEYRGIFVLTPEGNLKGGLVYSFDKQTNRIAASINGNVQYLTKRSP